jgi:hypothetical protein
MQVFIISTHLGDRAQLEREEVGLTRVPEAAAIPDHWIRLDRLVRGAAREIPELVRAEIHGAVDDGTRREGLGEHAEAVGHAADEVVGAVLGEEGTRMHVLERVEHHEFSAQ